MVEPATAFGNVEQTPDKSAETALFLAKIQELGPAAEQWIAEKLGWWWGAPDNELRAVWCGLPADIRNQVYVQRPFANKIGGAVKLFCPNEGGGNINFNTDTLPKEDNTMLYVGIAGAVLVLAIGGYFLMKKGA
jgi:hypothetical protein